MEECKGRYNINNKYIIHPFHDDIEKKTNHLINLDVPTEKCSTVQKGKFYSHNSQCRYFLKVVCAQI